MKAPQGSIVRLIKISASITLLFYLCLKFNISAGGFFSSFPHKTWIFPAFLIPLAVIPALTVNRWRVFLHYSGIDEKFFTLYKITHIAQFWGLFLPSSSAFILIKMHLIGKRHPGRSGVAGSTVLLEKAMGLFLFLILGIIGSFAVSGVKNIVEIRATMLAMTGMFIAAGWIAVHPGLFAFFTRRLGQIRLFQRQIAYIVQIHEALVLFPKRSGLGSSIPLILLFQLAGILNVYMLFRAAGLNISYYQHMAFVPLITMVTMIPVSIGGWGVRESVFVYFYGLVGVSPAVAFSVSVVNYMLLCVLPAAIGGVITMISHIGKREIMRIQKKAAAEGG